MATHTCPVCGRRHDVHPVLHQLAYGRQLTCSCACKAAWRRLVLAKHTQEIEEEQRRAAEAECRAAGRYTSATGRLVA